MPVVDEKFLAFLSKPLDFKVYICPHIASKGSLEPIGTTNDVVLQLVAGKAPKNPRPSKRSSSSSSSSSSSLSTSAGMDLALALDSSAGGGAGNTSALEEQVR